MFLLNPKDDFTAGWLACILGQRREDYPGGGADYTEGFETAQRAGPEYLGAFLLQCIKDGDIVVDVAHAEAGVRNEKYITAVESVRKRWASGAYEANQALDMAVEAIRNA